VVRKDNLLFQLRANTHSHTKTNQSFERTNSCSS